MNHTYTKEDLFYYKKELNKRLKDYYEKYLDLTQYDLAKLPKTSKSLGKGVKNQTGRKVTTGRLSLFTIYYSISPKSIK
jgi:hypothetical protein